ncbi:MAG: T9SS type A sorting domain-containing protein [Ginsengibacter sp.]
MKYNLVLIAFIFMVLESYAVKTAYAPPEPGFKLLYYQDSGWLNPASWIQINAPSGQIPIQRIPTGVDDIIFSKAISGLDNIGFRMDSINVGGVTNSQYQCHSMQVSGTHLNFLAITIPDLGTNVSVQTNNGGYVLIDSGAVFERGLFALHGGNPSVADLGVYNSTLEEYFSHGTYSYVQGEDYSRINFVNSYFSGNGFNGGAHSQLYASNSTFDTYSFSFGDNSADTVINCKIGDVNGIGIYNLNLFFGKSSTLVSDGNNIFSPFGTNIYTSGLSFKTNIKPGAIAYYVDLSFMQEDTAHPLPNIIDGNISLAGEVRNGLAIQSELWISGDLNGYSPIYSSYYDSTGVFVNAVKQFVIGGMFNFGNSTAVSACNMGYCHYKLVFFGNQNSNIDWPTGFPVDTLVIAKSNCAKVTVVNPLYVASETRIDSGQLALYPNAGVPNKLVCGGNLNILKGGGLLLKRDSLGNVANIAVRGVINDQNISIDSVCHGLSNPYYGRISFFTGALPITLINFSGRYLQQSVQLNWEVGNQENLEVFAVEKSFNGSSFTEIGEVAPKQAGADINYQFIDNGTLADVVYYRLKIIDKDGKFSYSNVIRINATTIGISIYPNPVSDQLLIKNLPFASSIHLSILNTKGESVKEINFFSTSTSLYINTANLPGGAYILLMLSTNRKSAFKFIKQ